MKAVSLFFAFIIIFISFTGMVNVNAINTGFDTCQLPDEEKDSFLTNVSFSLISEEPVKTTFECFDVNSNELIAIGQNTSDRKTICVYSNEGCFQYGYTFNCSGSFGVEWDSENLNVYFARSSVIVSISPSGEVIDAFEVQNTVENNSYFNNFMRSTQRTIGNAEYLIGNNLGILNVLTTSYSQITVKNAGYENIIYDASSMQFSRVIVTTVIFCVALVVAIVLVLLRLKKKAKTQGKVRNH